MAVAEKRKPTINHKNLVERKNVTLFESKVDESGTFTGYASVFGVKDLHNDIVTKGAFKKTVQDNGGLFVLLDQHDQKVEIGLIRADEDEKGLFIEGELYIDPDGNPSEEVRAARETYVKMKRRHKAGKPLQFSIGYRAINPTFEKGVRMLKEVALAEVSTVTFPALPQAITTGVKAADRELLVKAFGEDYARALDRELPWTALDIAGWTIRDTIYRAIHSKDLSTLEQDLGQYSMAVLEHASAIVNLSDPSKALAALEDTLDQIPLPELSTESDEPHEHSDDKAAGDELEPPQDPVLQALLELKQKMQPEASTLSSDLEEAIRNFRKEME